MAFLVGLDFGTESARGVLIDAEGVEVAHHVHPYRHGVITGRLPDGTPLPVGYALQDAADYVEAAVDILSTVARGKEVAGIGLDFTASSPLPATADGRALSALYPSRPHTYVKLWKHAAAQPYADAINAGVREKGERWLDHCGGRLSGEWAMAKAAQVEREDPATWGETARWIEGGDWLVWQLTGVEARSKDFASYKMHYNHSTGYPPMSPGLKDRSGGAEAGPFTVGHAAGRLAPQWAERTGVRGSPAVAVAVIDSHVVLPSVGGTTPGTLVGALGTSAVFLLVDDVERPLNGLESMARDAALPGLWCWEAGQAGFGDMLSWFVRTFPRSDDPSINFKLYNDEAASLQPGSNHLVALDWWSGNRVPHGDSSLSGVLAGLTMGTTAAGIYRALVESVCYGARFILERCGDGRVKRVVLTSGLAMRNPLLVQIMADVMGREVQVPDVANPTARGAAIHGAVAAGVVSSFQAGADKYGATTGKVYRPDAQRSKVYDELYNAYRLLGEKDTREALHVIRKTASAV